ncbi:MAG: hypothetical protein JWQ04_1877 [Pedosphaera sp.]|nr:hypothetical protein [Pedosphaera sp.]
MNTGFDIVIWAQNPDASLVETAASLAAQTDRQFGVVLSDNHSSVGQNHLDTTHKKLLSAGISVRRVTPPGELSRIEHWNWAHSQSQAAWLKPLSPGEHLKPLFVERLKQRISERPKAQVIRCDIELRTEWGPEILTAPFELASISAGEFTNYFPAHLEWVSHSGNFAYGRTAWQAMGGYSIHQPASAALNLNVMLSLHHGLENLPETLVSAEWPAHDNRRERISYLMELWLILLQARNYCLAARLPWTSRCLLLRSLTAALRRR